MPGPRRPFPRRDPAGFERLRARVREIERAGATDGDSDAIPFGAAEIDDHLPWGGLPRGALHEVMAGHAGAATGFCAALAARAGGEVLWCENARTLDAGALYAPGLARFGLDPARLIAVRARRDAEALWTLEEGLRCRRLAAVIGEVGALTLTAGRRLQLAAEAGGGTAFILSPAAETPPPGAATTRWRVDSIPGGAAARWRVELFRCRGGAARTWALEWRDATGDFAVAAPVRDGPAVPRQSRMAG